MKKVLVIEDNESIRENLVELLELADYEVHQAGDGKEGVEEAYKVKPDLILCDVMMPKVDGYGVLKILREREETSDIPFIFLTAKGDKSDFRKGMTLGADDYIPKPFDDTVLMDTIKVRLKKAAKSNKIKVGISKTREVVLEELLKRAKDYDTKTYQPKEFIYKAGNQPHWVYIIESGLVKLSRTNDYGKEMITQLAVANDCVGYEAIMGDTIQSECATALKETVVRMLPKAVFLQVIQENLSFSAYFTRELLTKSSNCQEHLLELAYSSVRKKVANALLRYAFADSETSIKVSRDDLAALAGTAKETLVRTLKEFKEEGLIKVERRLIDILNKKALQEMPH